MRSLAVALATTILIAGPLDAQMHQGTQGGAQSPPHGMMGPGRMQGAGTMGAMGAMGMHDMEMTAPQGAAMTGPMGPLRGFAPEALLAHREELELSDDQITKLTALQHRADSAAAQAHAPAHAAMAGLQQALASERPDVDDVRRLFEAHQTAMGKVQWAHAEAALEARGLLTPIQYGMVRGMQMRPGMAMPHGPQGGMR